MSVPAEGTAAAFDAHRVFVKPTAAWTDSRQAMYTYHEEQRLYARPTPISTSSSPGPGGCAPLGLKWVFGGGEGVQFNG